MSILMQSVSSLFCTAVVSMKGVLVVLLCLSVSCCMGEQGGSYPTGYCFCLCHYVACRTEMDSPSRLPALLVFLFFRLQDSSPLEDVRTIVSVGHTPKP